jgi:hypothetical protein
LITVSDEDAFVSRIRYLLTDVDKPVAFVAGSGLTRGNVAGVQQLVAAMRASLGDDADRARFDGEVVGPTWGDKYQQAAKFLLANRDLALINRVIRAAVLGSCRSVSAAEIRQLSRDEPALRQLEIDAQWSLDPGVQALGQLLVSMPTDVRGPVITTNFDPHIEIAVRRAGGQPFTQWIDIDGKITTVEDTGTIDIIHVHGLWRRGDTLHTVPQLTRDRPRLAGSLREALRGHNVVILGYSGWPDAFSRTLMQQAREREFAGMSIIWCHYGPLTDADMERELFRELSAGNAAVVYENVDSNSALMKLADAYSTSTSLSGLPTGSSIRGWTRVDTAFLALRSLDQARSDSARFFDGVEPTWKVAVDTNVPRLSFARELLASFKRSAMPITAGVGPMGEGKSLGIRQVVAELAATPALHVLWREPGTILRIDDILNYAVRPDQTLVLASDDGDLLVDDLILLTKELQRAGRTQVRMLLVAAERDWRNAGGFVRLGSSTSMVSTRPLTLEDAQLIVDSWEAVEGTDLGKVAGVPADERAALLQRSAIDPAGGEGTSLIGAMLDVRYGDQLIERISNLLDKLQRQTVAEGVTLSAAFLMICIMHSTVSARNPRSRPISLRVLAAATTLSDMAAQYLVVDPLGREAAVSQHGDDVWTRHSSIASAAMAASRQRDPEELSRLLSKLIPAAIGLASESGPLADDIYPVAYLSRALPRGSDAVSAGQAARDAEPRRLVYVTSLIATYREAGLESQALELAESTWTSNVDWKDPDSLPLFLLDWATSAGQAGQPTMNVLIDAVALTIEGANVREYTVQKALLGMGVGFRGLHGQTKELLFLDAVAGVTTLARELELDQRSRAHVRNHEKYLRDNHAAPIPNRADALQKVQEALNRLQAAPPEPLRAYIAAKPLSVLSLPQHGTDEATGSRASNP